MRSAGLPTVSAPKRFCGTDLDLVSHLKAIQDARMRRGERIQAWYLLLVAVLGILCKCENLLDVEHFAQRHHVVLNEAHGLGVKYPLSDSTFRYFIMQKEVTGVDAAISDWTITSAQSAAGKTLNPIQRNGSRE